MIQKYDVMPPELIVGNVAILLGKVLEQKDRISRTEMPESIPEKIPLKTRREPVRPPLSFGSGDGMFAGRACHETSLRCPEAEAALPRSWSMQDSATSGTRAIDCLGNTPVIR
jgi:hypothetical protein